MKNLNFLSNQSDFGLENGSGMSREWLGIDSTVSRKLFTLLFVLLLGFGQMWGKEYTELFSIAAGDVVSGSSYKAHTATVSTRGWVITFGGNNSSVGTNSGNRSNCKLSSYSKYAVSPVTTSSTASAFACTSSISNVSKISYTFSGGSNQTSTKVYLLYSSNNTTFSQIELTSGTQGATISSGTAYEFAKCTGYFALLFESTNSSGNWRIDGVNIKFYEEETASCSKTPTMSFTPNSVEKTVGDDNFTKTVTISGKGGSQTVAYSSSNTSVATVNSSTGEVTIKSNGSTTITASVSESGDYCSASASYTLTVNKPSYTVNWYVGGNQVKTQSVTKDETATLPSTPADNALGGSCSSLKFMGWSETNIGPTGTTAPADLFTAAPTITSAKNYHAVFAEESISGSAAPANITITLTSSFSAGTKITSGIFSATIAKGDGTNAPVWNGSDEAVRSYGSNTCTLASSGAALKDVTFTGTMSKGYSVPSGKGSYSSNKWTAPNTTTTSVTLTVPSGSGHNKIKTITASFQGSQTITYSNYITSCCQPLVSINGSFNRYHLKIFHHIIMSMFISLIFKC